jgi:hypothetical protein
MAFFKLYWWDCSSSSTSSRLFSMLIYNTR